MGLLSGSLNQTATYWAATGIDKYGSTTFAAPVEIKVRWEDKQMLVTDARGQQRRTNSEIWVDQDLTNNGFLLLGTSTEADPTPLTSAFEIIKFDSIPGLGGSEFVRKAVV